MTKQKEKQKNFDTPFNKYFAQMAKIFPEDKEEFSPFLILRIVEETGEMARACLAKHGRKQNNLLAQNDETYIEEMGDLLISVMRLAQAKNVNLDDLIERSLHKLEARRQHPKGEEIYGQKKGRS